jgi:hypothetical protein
MGKTLDTYFDRRGGMSPVLARTLGVQASPPVTLPSGQLSYIKVDLSINVMRHALLTLLARLAYVSICLHTPSIRQHMSAYADTAGAADTNDRFLLR